jgi:hypothetical protein
MATKFTNNQSRVFNELLNGGDFDEILQRETEKVNNAQYYCSDEQAKEYREQHIQDVINVKKFFDNIKLFDEPEVYRVDPWGYEQTNYENVKVLGQVGGSMVCVIDNGYSDVYTIQKKKYTDKAEYTYLDSGKVRSTSWEEPYTNEAMAEQSMYNAYYGH